MIKLHYGDGSWVEIEKDAIITNRKSTGSARIDAAFDGIESFILALRDQGVRGLSTTKLQAALRETEDAIMNNMETG